MYQILYVDMNNTKVYLRSASFPVDPSVSSADFTEKSTKEQDATLLHLHLYLV